MPRLSVVIPVYNGSQFIGSSIESVLDQRFKDFELIVIDDGSTDKSVDVIMKYAERDKRIKVLTQLNFGECVARNRAAQAASGEFLAGLDADDVCAPTRFINQIQFLDAHPDVGVVGGAARIINELGETIGRKNLPVSRWLLDSILRNWSPFVHSAVTVRRSTFDLLGGYRECFKHAGDYDLWLRAREISALSNLPDIVVSLRRHRHQMSYEGAKAQAFYTMIAKTSAEARSKGATDPVTNKHALLDQSELKETRGRASGRIDGICTSPGMSITSRPTAFLRCSK